MNGVVPWTEELLRHLSNAPLAVEVAVVAGMVALCAWSIYSMMQQPAPLPMPGIGPLPPVLREEPLPREDDDE